MKPAAAIVMALLIGITHAQSPAPAPAPIPAPAPTEKAMTLTSTAFETNTALPVAFTADGDGTSPPLAWADAPKGTVSYAIMMDDPQARGFVHWIIWGIPSTESTLSAKMPRDLEVKSPAGARQGVTSWGRERPGYWGSAPGKGSGVHHYTFTLYALDSKLELAAGASPKEFKKAIEGHVLAKTMLVGLYERPD
ncbi:MAG: YbhB/YbcL family Raf kinase inhibitor-like protein [Phycisphaerales bacterium]|nr:YbhB/YbcL family Raf kinase inhibitor-like protein [Phycisphaerales bacterium]